MSLLLGMMLHLNATRGRQPEVYVVIILKRLWARDVMPERIMLFCIVRTIILLKEVGDL